MGLNERVALVAAAQVVRLLGPLMTDGVTIAVDGRTGTHCRFLKSGVSTRGQDSDEYFAEWGQLLGLEVEAPTIVRVSWIPAGVIAFLSPVGQVRLPWTTVRLNQRDKAREFVLGRAQTAPYRYPELDAMDATLEVLSDSGKLAVLGDIDRALDLISGVAAVRSPITSVTYRRVRRHLRALGVLE